MIKVIVIGCGGMGNHHTPILTELDNVEVVGVCDLIEERARQLGEKVGAEWGLDYREMLGGADAVWICTPPLDRLEIVTAAAAAGKHIFSEKPICLDLEEADQMIAAAGAAGVKYMLGYVLRYTNPYRLLHDTFVRGELGDLVACWTRRYMPIDLSDRWYGQQEASGGVILDFGSHDCDWLRWIGGDVKAVFAKTFIIRPTMHADEHGQTMMLFQGGGMGTMDVSWSSYLSESSMGIVGSNGAIILRPDGSVRKKIGDGEEELVDTEGAAIADSSGNPGKKSKAGEASSPDGKETLHEHFFRCITEDREPITSAADGRTTLATILAAQQSARSGTSVEVANAH